jgi:hypothetical protein
VEERGRCGVPVPMHEKILAKRSARNGEMWIVETMTRLAKFPEDWILETLAGGG